MSSGWDKVCPLPMWCNPACEPNSEWLSLRWTLCGLLQMDAFGLFLRWLSKALPPVECLLEMELIYPEISSFWQHWFNGIQHMNCWWDHALSREGSCQDFSRFWHLLVTCGLWKKLCDFCWSVRTWSTATHSLVGQGETWLHSIKGIFIFALWDTFVHSVLSWYFFCKSSAALACVSVFKGFFTENKISGSKWKGCHPRVCFSGELADQAWEAWIVCLVLAPGFRNCTDLLHSCTCAGSDKMIYFCSGAE